MLALQQLAAAFGIIALLSLIALCSFMSYVRSRELAGKPVFQSSALPREVNVGVMPEVEMTSDDHPHPRV